MDLRTLEGTIRATGARLTSAIEGRPCVWFRSHLVDDPPVPSEVGPGRSQLGILYRAVATELLLGDDRPEALRITEELGVDFELELATSVVAVTMKRYRVTVPEPPVGRGASTLFAHQARLDALCRRHGYAPGLLSEHARFQEAALCTGQRVRVTGAPTTEHDPAARAGYRGVSERLRLASPPGGSLDIMALGA